MPAQTRKTDQAQALLYHARAATPFCSQDRQPCASIPAAIDSRRVVPLRSAAFRDWLIANYYNEFEAAPSPTAFRTALRLLEARALSSESHAQKVDRRIGFEGDPFMPSKIILDLANADGEILEITSRGWELASNFGHSFVQSPATLPLPRPVQASAGETQPFAQLSHLLRLSPENDVRVRTWLAAALRPIGPYPVLVLTGPAASGKSFAARALRSLVDPSTTPVRRLPARDRELLQLAFQNWILVFDQIHRIGARISEALCAITSGDALEIVQPDLRDPLVFQIARPMILIAPDDETLRGWIPPRTLANRTLTIHLDHIAAPRPEAFLWRQFEEIRPTLIAALADTVSTALGRIRDTDVGNVARFADSATWAAAAAPALGIEPSDIVASFADPAAIWSGSDPLRAAIHALLETKSTWTGEVTDLLVQLQSIVPLAALPNTPKGLTQALQRIPGIGVMRNRTKNTRTLSITKSGDASQKTAANDAPPTAILP